MSGLIAVKYKREPIMLRYSFWSTGSPSSSASSTIVVLIGVDRGFESSILNFLRMSYDHRASSEPSHKGNDFSSQPHHSDKSHREKKTDIQDPNHDKRFRK
jgi:hypothetical protein